MKEASYGVYDKLAFETVQGYSDSQPVTTTPSLGQQQQFFRRCCQKSIDVGVFTRLQEWVCRFSHDE